MSVIALLLLPSLLGLLSFVDPADDLASGIDVSQPRHVRALYFDTVGRPPRSDELLAAPRLGLEPLLAELCGTQEFWENWYEEELYYFLLLDNFRPEDLGPRKRLSDRLSSGEIHVADAVRALASSSAFHRANPGNDTFVTVVFEQLLGQEVQRNTSMLEAGKRMYDGQAASLWGEAGRSQADVVRIAIGHEDFASHYITRHYERLIGERMPRKEARRAATRFRDDPASFPQIVGEWLSSEAYAERLQRLRPKTDRQFMRSLYLDLTGELPDLSTMQRHRTALAAVADGGPLRSVIARVLVDRVGGGMGRRGERTPDELVQDCYERFYGRPPSREEAQVIANLYAQCECAPEVVILSLVTHPEYQHY